MKPDCKYCRAASVCLPGLLMTDHQKDPELNLIDHRRTFHRNDYLARRYSPQRYIYAIHSGCFKASFSDSVGREHIASFYHPGDVVGLASIFYQRNLVDVVALDTSNVCYIKLEAFKNLIQKSESIREQALNIFSEQLWRYYQRSGNFNAQELVIQFLLSVSHHAALIGSSPSHLNLAMGRHDIANYLGLSSETVSRIISKLKQKELIEVERSHIDLLNIPRLKQLSANSDICPPYPNVDYKWLFESETN